jgi:gas vesicle protein
LRFRRCPSRGSAVIVFPTIGCYHPISIQALIQEVFRMSDHDGSSFLWFLAGVGIGGLVGILYAPRAGRETREEIKARAEQGRQYVRSRAQEAREQATEWVDKGKDVVNQQKDQFRAAYEAGRQAYQEATAETGTSKNL